MGRRNRSSSINRGSPSSSSTFTDSPSAANNSHQQQRNKQQGVSKEEILACHSLLSHFLHESSHHYGDAPVESRDGEQLLSFDQQQQRHQQYIGGNLINSSNSGRGKTPFLHAVTLAAAASSSTCNNNQQPHNINEISSESYYSENERRKMDGLYMMDKLLLRMREFDALDNVIVSNSAVAAAGGGGCARKGGGDKRTITTTSSHVYQLMTTRNDESGYSPLHCAILHRDLFTLLLLLRHATMTTTATSTTLATAVDDVGTDNASLIHHPLRLLDDTNNINNNNEYQLINTISTFTDNEGLTPLQLLGKTSSIQLEYCRDTLTWRSLMETRRLQKQQQQQEEMNSLLLSPSASNERSSPSSSSSSSSGRRRRRFRRRMISFGDDRDYDSLQYDIELDNNNNGEGRRRRSRGNSFNIDFDDDRYSDDDDDEGEEEDEGRGADNDLRVLHDNVDFNVLADDHDETDDNDDDRLPSQQQQQQQQQQRGGGKRSPSYTTTNDYGCEVLTFGRVDHCALGVPQLSSRIQKDDCGGNIPSTSFDSKTYKPKRVETFALGELRRNWSSSASLPPSSSSPSSSSSIRRDRKNAIDSPAVAVAASTHHTLVMTRSGQLFSFGLGKGGRLGLGEFIHYLPPCFLIIHTILMNFDTNYMFSVHR